MAPSKRVLKEAVACEDEKESVQQPVRKKPATAQDSRKPALRRVAFAEQEAEHGHEEKDKEEEAEEVEGEEEEKEQEQEEQEVRSGIYKVKDLDDIKAKPTSEKIEIFREMVVDQKVKDPASLLKKLFDHNEMCKLWGRLKTMVKHADPKVQKEWDTVCKLNYREGKVQVKNATLATALAYPDSWQDHFVKDVLRVTGRQTKGEDIKWYYRGELEQLHGKAEAEDFIRKQKYIEDVDEQGDKIYRKAQKHETNEKSIERIGETTKSSAVNKETAEKIDASMEAWWPGESNSYSAAAVLDGKGNTGKGNGKQGGKDGLRRGPSALMGKGGETDENSDEGKGKGKGGKGKEKTPEEEAKFKGNQMVGHLSQVSAKLLATLQQVANTKAAASIITAAKDKQKELEQHRAIMLKMVTQKTINVKEVKKACCKGSTLLTEGGDLLRFAKPFVKK